MTVTGRCLCRATTYAFDGPMAWTCHCHCESCRRNCSAPFTTFFGVPRGRFCWTGQVTGRYVSSPGITRHFCTTCGTPMAYDNDADVPNIHLYAASLDDPSGFQPGFHVHWSEHLPWVHLHDDLRKFPASGG